MKEQRLNYLAILAGTILMQIIPMVWYGMIFRQQWMDLNHITQEMTDARQASMGAAYAVGVIHGLVSSYLLARLFISMKVESALRGCLNGLSIGFAFGVLMLMSVNLFSFQPYALSWINGGHYMLDYGVIGLILGGWRKYNS